METFVSERANNRIKKAKIHRESQPDQAKNSRSSHYSLGKQKKY